MEITIFLYILGFVYVPSFANTTVGVTPNVETTVLPKVVEKNEVGNETKTTIGVKEVELESRNETEDHPKIEVRKGRKPGGYWKSFLIPLGGNLKMGLHGDLTNVASGNLESKGSIGVSINGRDFSIGGKWGVGGNLGQGVNNAGSLGVGGTGEIRPPKWIKRTTTAAPAPETQSTGTNVKQVVVKSSDVQVPAGNLGKVFNTKQDKGEWKNFNDYAKVFIETPKP